MQIRKSRAIYLVPNGITTANVISGFAAVLAAIDGNFVASAWAIIAAGIFDLFDGRIARVLGASSRFGEEYDTLSDLISFGMAPALLFYQFGLRGAGLPGAALALFYLLCVAFRLARFAVGVGAPDDSAKGFFQGLSSPVSAATAAAFILFTHNRGWAFADCARATALLVASLGALMVSSLRFPSFKGIRWRSAFGTGMLATLAVLLALALTQPGYFLFPILGGLLVVVVICDLAYRVRAS